MAGLTNIFLNEHGGGYKSRTDPPSLACPCCWHKESALVQDTAAMLLPRCWIHVPLALLLLSFSFGRRVRNEAFLINISSRIIGISSSRPTHATRQPNDRPPLRLPWGYDRRQQRARPAPQAAGESASVDTDVRDLKERAPLVEIKPAKFHNLRQVAKPDRCRWELLYVQQYSSTSSCKL